MEGTAETYRSALPEGGPSGRQPYALETMCAFTFFSSGTPRATPDGRSAVRDCFLAPVREAAAAGGDSRRDDDAALPPFVGCDGHSCAEFDQEQYGHT